MAAVLRTSDFANHTAAVKALKPGDALIFDNTDSQSGSPLPTPPDDVQIIGGSAHWLIDRDVQDLLFFEHVGRFNQTAGVMKHCAFYSLGFPSKFTGLDSCLFIMQFKYRPPYTSAEPPLLIEGFLRSTTLLDFFIGQSTGVPNHRGTANHVIRINATHPEGDGRGTLIANTVTHGAMERTDIHVINGRGITIANTNSEYAKYAEPYIVVENGAEVALVNLHPGGYEPGNEKSSMQSSSGLTVYRQKSYAGAVVRLGGQRNIILAGEKYKSYSAGIQTASNDWESHILLRDPFAQLWNPSIGTNFATNLAEPVRYFGYGVLPRFLGPPRDCADPWDSPGCGKSTGFLQTLDGDQPFRDYAGSVSTSSLKPGGLPWGPKLYSNYLPRMPDLRGGPGENMTGKGASEIEAALAADKTVFLGPGTYNLSKTISKGTVYGAGIDKTILKFPNSTRASEGNAGLFNLTVQGGKIGFGQTTFAGVPHIARVKFSGQSVAAITLGNAQQASFHDLIVENTPYGFRECRDEVPCGEDMTPGGGAMIDKVSIYGSDFRNIGLSGVEFNMDHNGDVSIYGCTFTNMPRGVKLARAGMKGSGFTVSGSSFDGVENPIYLTQKGFVDHVTIKGKGSGTGIAGDILGVVNAEIQGMSVAVTNLTSDAIIYNVQSDGLLEHKGDTWIARSRFKGLDVSGGARIGGTDISGFIDKSEFKFDETAPSKPGNIKVVKQGKHNVISWDASSDPESGILQYIIARVFPAAEIGRTQLDWRFGASRNRPGRRLSFVDTTANGVDFPYFVIAVNGARITSEDKMDNLRLFPSHFQVTRTGDTIRVPEGAFQRGLTAVDYSRQRSGTTSIARRSGGLTEPGALAARPEASNGDFFVYDISGRLVMSWRGISSDVFETAFRSASLPRGTYRVLTPSGAFNIARLGNF